MFEFGQWNKKTFNIFQVKQLYSQPSSQKYCLYGIVYPDTPCFGYLAAMQILIDTISPIPD